MFYGVVEEQVIQEGKILDFIKKIFKKKNKDLDKLNNATDEAVQRIWIFDKTLYIIIDDKDKLPELREQCKKDADIINDHEDEAKAKCAEYCNKIIKKYAKKDNKEPNEVKESDIEFEECAYITSEKIYSLNINLVLLSNVMYNYDVFVCCNIKVTEDGKVTYSLFEFEDPDHTV